MYWIFYLVFSTLYMVIVLNQKLPHQKESLYLVRWTGYFVSTHATREIRELCSPILESVLKKSKSRDATE